ncbi:hypothetical protein [uncultured phage_MedDCM-OCT-S28-C3]|uniref:Uncharacterized protein n=1 Tax=uncultured phage_MedDCM-OCT-S28-C3 TaxID=2740802 RepID=A0A6S4PFU9_9CAUD|nr:hypothetical protein HOQ59_gp19 [uncultured phage_MedDCM-OCT-S28-C3]BAQ94013.1 hypothetical protein [uncultured phage_MedDCM-OCT-S28-C3]
MTTTNTQQTNWFLTAGTLRAAFTQDKRQDGSTFWCLTEQARQSVDDLTEWLHSLHDDELPNDWRYETIVDICNALVDEDDLSNADPGELSVGIANNLTDIYNHSLFQWYADIPSRVAYIEEGVLSGIVSSEANTIDRLMCGQCIAIEQMAYKIVERLGQGK